MKISEEISGDLTLKNFIMQKADIQEPSEMWFGLGPLPNGTEFRLDLPDLPDLPMSLSATSLLELEPPGRQSEKGESSHSGGAHTKKLTTIGSNDRGGAPTILRTAARGDDHVVPQLCNTRKKRTRDAAARSTISARSDSEDDWEEEGKQGAAGAGAGANGEAARQLRRLLRNRMSAQQARERKKVYVVNLEEQTKACQMAIDRLGAQLERFESDNNTLRRIIRSMKGDANINEEEGQPEQALDQAGSGVGINDILAWTEEMPTASHL